MARSASPPSLKDLKLFLRIVDAMGTGELSLGTVSLMLGVSKATISTCLSDLEVYSGKQLLDTSKNPPELTAAATDDLRDKAAEIVDLWERLESDEARTRPVTVRIATTESLRTRVFAGPVAAFMLWLRGKKVSDKSDKSRSARVEVHAFDNLELRRQVRSGRYDFGFSWDLPQSQEDDFLEFEDVADDLPADYGIEVVALCPHQAIARHDLPIYKLFHQAGAKAARRTLRLSDLTSADIKKDAVNTSRVVVIRSEPKDVLQVRLTAKVNDDTAVRVNTYEEVLLSVRMGVSDLGWGPAWYRDRKNVVARTLTDDSGVPFRRGVKLCKHKGGWLDQDAYDFYHIFRLYLADPENYPKLFASSGAPADVLGDPQMSYDPAQVVDWLESNKKLIDKKSDKYTSTPDGVRPR